MVELADGLDDIREHYRQHGPRCTAGISIAAMDEQTRDKVMRALAIAEARTDPGISYASISAWLETLGVRVRDQTISRHYRGQCGCDR